MLKREIPVTIANRPSVDVIQKQMVSGESPEDFIKRNLERLAAPTAASPTPYEAVSQPLQPEVQPEQALEPSSSDTQSALQDQTGEDSHQVESEPAATPDSPEQSSQKEQQPGDSKQGGSVSLADNIKILRRSLNENKQALKEKEETIKKIAEERDKYQRGEVLPEKVKELESEVQILRKYQAIVDLESSPEYQDKFVKPVSGIIEKLENLGKDYNLPEEVVNKALTFSNQRELNRFLSEHFDDIGALEAKNLIIDAKKLQTEAQEARKAPKEALSKLVAEGEVARQNKIREQRQTITGKAKNSWVGSLTKLQKDGKIPEITIKSNDSEHNEKVARPIITAAATEYGKLVSRLVDAGLETLPDDVSDGLAEMVVLAVASAAINEQRNYAVSMFNNIEEASKRDTEYTRPPIGGNFGTGAAAPPKPAAGTVEQESRKLMETILPKYQRGLAGSSR